MVCFACGNKATNSANKCNSCHASFEDKANQIRNQLKKSTLRKILRDKDVNSDYKNLALGRLASLGFAKNDKALITSLISSGEINSEIAIDALEAHYEAYREGKEFLSYIEQFLSDSLWPIRERASQFLKNVPCEDGVNILIKGLKKEFQKSVILSIWQTLSTFSTLTEPQFKEIISLIPFQTPKNYKEIAKVVAKQKRFISNLTHEEILSILDHLCYSDMETLVNIGETLKECRNTQLIEKEIGSKIKMLQGQREDKIKVCYLFALSYFLPPLFQTLVREGLVPSVGRLIIEVLLSTIQARDNYTHDHCKRVAEYTEILVNKGRGDLRLTDNEIPLVKEGALIHDLGKLYWPDSILTSNKKFSSGSKQRKIINAHPSQGIELLDQIRDKTGYVLEEKIKNMIRLHHEKEDGSGPLKKRGGDITLCASLVSIADIFDALTQKRPYRNTQYSPDRAILEITKMRDKELLKGRAIDIFLSAQDEVKEKYKELSCN